VRLSTGAAAAYRPDRALLGDEAGGGDGAVSSSSIVSSASSAASAILNIFNWGSWSANGDGGGSDESTTDESQHGGKRRAKGKAGSKASSSGELKRFGTCVATEIEIRNNGRTFSGDDWNRVRKIAEGNPNSGAQSSHA
jgi:hypothetical protein